LQHHGVPQTSELVLRTSIVASTIGVNHRSASTSSYANSRPCSCSRSSCTAGAIGGTTLAVGRCAASRTTERGVAALALRTAMAVGPSMGCRPRGGVAPLQGCQHTHRDVTSRLQAQQRRTLACTLTSARVGPSKPASVSANGSASTSANGSPTSKDASAAEPGRRPWRLRPAPLLVCFAAPANGPDPGADRAVWEGRNVMRRVMHVPITATRWRSAHSRGLSICQESIQSLVPADLRLHGTRQCHTSPTASPQRASEDAPGSPSARS